MTTTTITLRHKVTGELKIVDCGVEGKDYIFVSECDAKAKDYPDYDLAGRSSVSDKPINFVRPTTYGMW